MKFLIFSLLLITACSGNISRPDPVSDTYDSDGVSEDGDFQQGADDNNTSAGGGTGDDGGQNSPSLPRPSFVVINELYYDDKISDTDGHLFIEIVSEPSTSVAGYKILLVNGANGSKTDTITFDSDVVIPQDGYLLVADSKTGEPDETNVPEADVIDNFDPQNGPDTILIINPEGEVLDTLGYGEGMVDTDDNGYAMYEDSPSVLASAGKSLSRRDGLDTQVNLKDFFQTEPTPGQPNKVDLSTDVDSESQNTSDSLDPNDLTEEAGDDSTPESNPAEQTSDPESDSEETKDSPEEGSDSIDWEPGVYITEVVVDPQQDWNDTLPGDGILFNAVVGSGSVTSSDEWVEIANKTDESIDLSYWAITIMDDSGDYLLLQDADNNNLFFSAGGTLATFQSGEYLVIGNPPGDMKNYAEIELYNDSEILVDTVIVEDGDAESVAQESWQELDEDEWGLDVATPGF